MGYVVEKKLYLALKKWRGSFKQMCFGVFFMCLIQILMSAEHAKKTHRAISLYLPAFKNHILNKKQQVRAGSETSLCTRVAAGRKERSDSFLFFFYH